VGVAEGELLGIGMRLGLGLGDGDGLGLGDGDGLGLGLGLGLGDGDGLGGAHTGTEMMAVSIVTAPPRAKIRPSMMTPAPTVIDTAARMLPRNAESAPSVAELPSCQKTLQA
jgi:hypothetical protein